MTLYEVKEIATKIIDEHKQKGTISNVWRFGFCGGKTFLAKCSHRKKMISISRHFAIVATKEQIIDSTLHEISHGAVGPGFGHSTVWKNKAIEIGAEPIRCASYAELNNIPSRYIGKCPSCNAEFKAHRRLKNMERKICAKRACKARGDCVVWSTYKKGEV